MVLPRRRLRRGLGTDRPPAATARHKHLCPFARQRTRAVLVERPQKTSGAIPGKHALWGRVTENFATFERCRVVPSSSRPTVRPEGEHAYRPQLDVNACLLDFSLPRYHEDPSRIFGNMRRRRRSAPSGYRRPVAGVTVRSGGTVVSGFGSLPRKNVPKGLTNNAGSSN